MDNSLIAEMESHAHFIAGMPPQKRDDDDPVVSKSIDNAIKFLNQIDDKLDKPGIASGTTANPQTVLLLYWNVRNLKKLYGVSVGFKENSNCDVHWSGPGRYKRHVQDITLEDLLKLDVPKIFAEITRRSARYRINLSP